MSEDCAVLSEPVWLTLIVRVPDVAETPIPLRGTEIGSTLNPSATVSCPLSEPAIVGAYVTLRVQVPPEEIVLPAHVSASVKSPDTDTLIAFSTAAPVLVSVTV